MARITPKDRFYTKEHEWALDNGDGTVTVGITDHAQELLTDIVFVELPEKGKVVAQMETLAVVESVKSVSDVYAPVGGRVVDVNGRLEEHPETPGTDQQRSLRSGLDSEDCHGRPLGTGLPHGRRGI